LGAGRVFVFFIMGMIVVTAFAIMVMMMVVFMIMRMIVAVVMAAAPVMVMVVMAMRMPMGMTVGAAHHPALSAALGAAGRQCARHHQALFNPVTCFAHRFCPFLLGCNLINHNH